MNKLIFLVALIVLIGCRDEESSGFPYKKLPDYWTKDVEIVSKIYIYCKKHPEDKRQECGVAKVLQLHGNDFSTQIDAYVEAHPELL